MTANHMSWLLQTIEDPEIAKRFIESQYKKSRISYDLKLDISRQLSHINWVTDEAQIRPLHTRLHNHLSSIPSRSNSVTAQWVMNHDEKVIARPTRSATLAREYEFVAAAKSGDPLAFDALCKQSAHILFNVARRMTRTREDAEDVVQESFQKAYIHLKNFKGESQFSTWLCRIAMNAALMRLRKYHSHSEISLDECTNSQQRFSPLAVEDQNLNPEETYSEKEQQQILSVAVNELTPRIRKAIELRELEERSTKEVARIMGISVGAVKARVFHGRRKLFGKLKKKFPQNMTERLGRTGTSKVPSQGFG